MITSHKNGWIWLKKHSGVFTIRSNMGAIESETGGISSENGKPPLTSIGFEGGVDDRRHKLLLIDDEANRTSASQHIDADQQPLRIRVQILLLLVHQHRFNRSIQHKFTTGNKIRSQHKLPRIENSRWFRKRRKTKLGDWIGLVWVKDFLRGRGRCSGSTSLLCKNRRRIQKQGKVGGESRSPLKKGKGSAWNRDCLGFLPFTTNGHGGWWWLRRRRKEEEKPEEKNEVNRVGLVLWRGRSKRVLVYIGRGFGCYLVTC